MQKVPSIFFWKYHCVYSLDCLVMKWTLTSGLNFREKTAKSPEQDQQGPITLKQNATFSHFCLPVIFFFFCQVIYVIQADPKGWIPKWAVNMFAWQQALNVARIRKIIEVKIYCIVWRGLTEPVGNNKINIHWFPSLPS